MKRPLFWVCVLLSVIAVLRFLGCGGADRKDVSEADPPGQEAVAFVGTVCGKELRGETEGFLLTNLKAYQNAASSRQIISTLRKRNTEKIRCYLAAEGEALPKIGSEVVIRGSFSFFREATNPGEFNLAKYYQGRQVGGIITQGSLLAQGSGHHGPAEALLALREHFAKRLWQVFPSREAGILQAMLLGERTGLDAEIRELYQDGGILHVLSISGLHVTLLGMGLYRLLRRMGAPASVAAILSGTVLFLYGVMTGMSVSACRAIGMFLFRMLAILFGRTYDLLTAMAVMACSMLCLTPSRCMNSGFWLSFGSMLGVGAILPLWERFRAEDARERVIQGVPGERSRIGKVLTRLGGAIWEKLCAGLRAGISVWLATLPLLLYFYYEVPTYATFLNLLVIPAMGPVLLCGFLAMAVPGLGILGTVDVAAFALFERLCKGAVSLPWHAWNPGCPRPWQMAGYYLLLAAVLGGNGLARRGKHAFGTGRINLLLRHGMVLLVLPVLLLAIPTHRMTGTVFLDVGQGDCVCLRLENGQTWLYDCGSTSKNEVGKNILIPFLKHEGIRHVDGIFLSHGDQDHVNGVAELLLRAEKEGISIGWLYLPGTGSEAEEFAGILAAARAVPGLQISLLETGDELASQAAKAEKGRAELRSGVSFLVLHPRKEEGLSGNEASLCLLARLWGRNGEMSVLLTGDVEGDAEDALLEELRARGISRVTVLKCAHHGSKNSTTGEFLDFLDPRVTVISCGKNNRYGHPHEETLLRLSDAGCDVFRTDLQGCVTIRVDGKAGPEQTAAAGQNHGKLYLEEQK